jgi:hypothetical protein
MKLYHFTDLHRLEGGILDEGLRCDARAMNNFALPPANVVWLTDESELDIVRGWAIRPIACRITLSIPLSDRRLVHWGGWIYKHAPDIAERLVNCTCPRDHMSGLNRHWCYFGDVPLQMFRAVDCTVPKRDTRRLVKRLKEKVS